MAGGKTRIGNKIFEIKQGEIMESFDSLGNRLFKIDENGVPEFPNIGLQSVEIIDGGGVDANGNYKAEIEESTGDLVWYLKDSGAWTELMRHSQKNGDKALLIKNRGLTLGSSDSTIDTELVVGLRGDSTTVGMKVLTSDDNTNFTDVTDTAASSTGSTYPIFSNNPQVGAADYIGWDYPFCNFKLKTASVATLDGSSAVVREYWNGSAWTAFPAMAIDSTTLEQRGNAIGTVIGTEQIRFKCPDDFSKTTINGIEKYWFRFRVTGALVASGTVEQVKVGTDRWECDKTGKTVYYGTAEYKKDLPIPFKSLFDLQGSIPGNANITVSPGITIAGERNLLNDNAKDGKTGGFTIPVGVDTSRPVELSVSYAPDDNTSGDIEFELITSQVRVGDVLDGTLPEILQAQVISVNNQQDEFNRVTFEVDVESLTPGDSLAFAFYRDATGGNLDDTYGGAVKISLFSVRATFFTP
jgi:hypothetical protein